VTQTSEKPGGPYAPSSSSSLGEQLWVGPEEYFPARLSVSIPSSHALLLAKLLDSVTTSSLNSTLQKFSANTLKGVYRKLAPEIQEHLKHELGAGNLNLILSLSQESDPKVFFQELTALASGLQREGKTPLALSLYEAVASQRKFTLLASKAQQQRLALLGQGKLGTRLQLAAHQAPGQIFNFPMLLGMMTGGFSFRALRAVASNFLFRSPAPMSLLNHGARRLAMNSGALLGESAVFTGTVQGAQAGIQRIQGKKVAFSGEVFGQDFSSATTMLGSLRLFGWGAGMFGKGLQQLGLARRYTPAVLSHAGQYSGILAAQGMDHAQLGAWEGFNFLGALVTLGHFKAAGALMKVVTPKGFQDFERRMERLTQDRLQLPLNLAHGPLPSLEFLQKTLIHQYAWDLPQVNLKALNRPGFDPQPLLARLKQDPLLRELFPLRVGELEPINFGQHTKMVLGLDEMFFKYRPLPGGMELSTQRLLLFVHDMGKPPALRSGEKGLQHKLNPIFLQALFKQWKVDPTQTRMALALLNTRFGSAIRIYRRMAELREAYLQNNQEQIAHFEKRIRNNYGLEAEYAEKVLSELRQPPHTSPSFESYAREKALKAINEGARQAEMDPSDFLQLSIRFHQVDAGAWTTFANGGTVQIPGARASAFDDMFVFDTQKNRIRYNPYVQSQVDALAASIRDGIN